MSPALAELIKQQPWYEELTPAGLEIIAQAQKCEKAAQPRGETKSVASLLEFATEQAWYQDGLDEREATALAGVLEAYARSLTDDYATPLGPILATTLRDALFDVVVLPESGSMVVLVSANRADQGRKALGLAVSALPGVEGVVGKYPYHFLHIRVTSRLGEDTLGLSYNEFIAVATNSIDNETVIHEITHSTLYGIFPTWFEEGFAHFLEYYLTGSLDAGVRDYMLELRWLERDTKLDIRANRGKSTIDYLAERARGFLFLKSIYDMRGIEGVTQMVRSLRTRSLTDQELMRAIVADGTAEEQQRVAAVVCKQVVGSIRNYCVP